MNRTPILERYLVDCHTSFSTGPAAGVRTTPSCGKCPWATSDDEMATKGCHERWHLHSSNGKIRDSNARPSMLNGSDKQRLGLKHTPAPPSTVNSCISAINEPSYPPTAVTTRVEGSMTPSEQAAVEARISALEAEMEEERQKRTVVQTQLQKLLSKRVIASPLAGKGILSASKKVSAKSHDINGNAQNWSQQQTLAPPVLGNAASSS